MSKQTNVAQDPRKTETLEPQAPVGPVLKRLLGYITVHRGRFILSLVLTFVGVVFSAALPYLMGQAINILAGYGSQNDLMQLIIMTLVCAAALGLTMWQSNRIIQKLAQDALYHLRTEVYAHIQTLSLNFYDRQPIGELMSRVTNDIETIDNFFSYSLNQSITSVLTVVITVVVMLLINLPLAVVTLLAVPLMLGVALLLGRVAGPAFTRLQEQLGETNGFMEETLAGDKTLMAYGQQRTAGDLMEDLSVAARNTGAMAYFSSLTVSPVVSLVQNLQMALIALVGSLLAIAGAIGFGTVVTFMAYSAQLQSPIQTLGQIYNQLLSAVAGASRVFSILDETPTVLDKPDAKPVEIKGGHVVFQNVDFSYVKGRKILKNNSFEALPGQKIGLCGPTGAGKSTIINILTRYYDIDSGTITIDGQNIAGATQASLRQDISAVLQEPFLFSDTVMNNLKYARKGATDDECIAAAKQANAHEFIMQLPEQYNTLLTERGANLSQGQRQMLTIARAMVARPRMLILDEATSNVDTRTEKLIQEGLAKLMEGRTSFVIAHRLSTIRDAARILVINAGEIIEQGTHDELIAQKGFYYNLYMTQFRAKPDAA